MNAFVQLIAAFCAGKVRAAQFRVECGTVHGAGACELISLAIEIQIADLGRGFDAVILPIQRDALAVMAEGDAILRGGVGKPDGANGDGGAKLNVAAGTAHHKFIHGMVEPDTLVISCHLQAGNFTVDAKSAGPGPNHESVDSAAVSEGKLAIVPGSTGENQAVNLILPKKLEIAGFLRSQNNKSGCYIFKGKRRCAAI